MKALIDGDILVYQLGYSCESRWYEAKDASTGNIITFNTLSDSKQYEGELAEVELCRSCEPEFIVEDDLSDMVRYIMRRTNASTKAIYLSGSNNFRNSISPEYKSNRKDLLKPLHYGFIRNLLITEYGATSEDAMEADDLLGINQDKNTVIVSKDKDLLQVPGKHFKLHHNKKVTATRLGQLELNTKRRLEGTGFKFFCCQCLTGDAVDNIKGLHRVGDVAAYKAIQSAKSCTAAWDIVREFYSKHKREDLLINAQLLWILREPQGFFDETLIRD